MRADDPGIDAGREPEVIGGDDQSVGRVNSAHDDYQRLPRVDWHGELERHAPIAPVDRDNLRRVSTDRYARW